MSEGLFPFAVGTSAKPGSWFNCCTDFLNTLIIVTSINVDRQVRREWIDGRMAVTAENMGVAYLMLVLPGLSALNHYPILKQHMSGSGGEYAEKALQKKKTAEYARSLPKVGEYALTFDKHIGLMLAERSVMPNREIVPKDVRYDCSGFYKAIENGTIRQVLMSGYSSNSEFTDVDFPTFKKRYEDEFVVMLENTKRR